MTTRVEGIRTLADLAKLPWYETGQDGKIHLKDDCGLPPIIDIHSHVGWCYAIGRQINMLDSSEVQYFFDYTTDQDVLYEENHPDHKEGNTFIVEILTGVFQAPARHSTHTARNYVDEMARTHYDCACIHPISNAALGHHADVTLEARDLFPERFIPFAGVNPWFWGPKKEAVLQSLLDRGAKGVKFHPEFQFAAADGKDAMAMLGWCAAHSLPVLAHCGYTGSEPAILRDKAEPRRYVRALEAFPNLRIALGHTGLKVYKETLEVAKRFPEQVWIDISGQPVPVIQEILDQYDRERIMYASDWPFYPLALATARALVATEDCPEIRPALFRNNALAFLKMADTT
ncbi:MAG TPA: amidohydrolase family protein [Candidatus Hydrogenedentes bacterium]|nr:amidohydrolase family protein [Candidatus Hydrogenedentota bacterium]HPG68007.1 amidohydrolase family protein [Candidatus Hydrogenedentota bacterium]